MVPELFISAGALLWGIIRRAYVWAPAILLDAADYQERYIEPRLGWSVDLPAEVFPIALVTGLLFAAVLTFHDARSKSGKPDVVFEVRECQFFLSSRDNSRPEQPFNMAEVNLLGRMRNTGDVGADIEGARVALLERGWFWIWRKVDEQKAIELLNRLRAHIDPYGHDISVGPHKCSRDISEIWAYLSIPVSLKPDSKRAHRVRVWIDAVGQRRPTPKDEPVDLPAAFRAGDASFRRVDEIRGRTS